MVKIYDVDLIDVGPERTLSTSDLVVRGSQCRRTRGTTRDLRDLRLLGL